jgi:glycine/D-amino acid oxidase-like deaminating enzyme
MASVAAVPQADATVHPTSGGILETDLLIIGAGPAGASLACFLAQHGKEAQAPRIALLTIELRIEGHHAGINARHCRYSKSPHHEYGRAGMSARH